MMKKVGMPAFVLIPPGFAAKISVMRNFSVVLSTILFFSLAWSQSTALKVGDKAPDFELPDQNRKPVRLSDFHGKKNVVLAFYVLAFTGG